MNYTHWKGGIYRYMGVSVNLGPGMNVANRGFIKQLLYARDADTDDGDEISVFGYSESTEDNHYHYYEVLGPQRVVYKDAAGQVWVRRIENFFGFTKEGKKRFVMEG